LGSDFAMIVGMYTDLIGLARSNGLITTRDSETLGVDQALRKAIASGTLVRLRAGAYVDVDAWRKMSANERHRARVEAVHLKSKSQEHVFTHASAAALWDLPPIGEWPTAVHVAVAGGGRGRTRPDVHEHVLAEGTEVVRVRGRLATGPADTVLAVCTGLPFPHAVAVVDHALSVSESSPTGLCQRADLVDALDRFAGRNGHAAASRAIAFGTDRSGSVGESVSRALMHQCGFAAPELQRAFYDDDGLIGYADFYWPEVAVIGEFDGFGKYVREEFTHGRTAAQVVVAEKKREDRLRALGPTITRWGWEDTKPDRLARKLRTARIPLAR
jgi:hypothetical protein